MSAETNPDPVDIKMVAYIRECLTCNRSESYPVCPEDNATIVCGQCHNYLRFVRVEPIDLNKPSKDRGWDNEAMMRLWDILLSPIDPPASAPIVSIPDEIEEWNEPDEPNEPQRTSHYNPEWRALRIGVWERDGGICQVCGDGVIPADYECGHIIDRCAGGQDELDNLVVMCNLCNRFKPVHDTIEEFNEWKKSKGYKGVFAEAVEAYKRGEKL